MNDTANFNKRGTAERSKEKSERIATHKPVIALVVDAFGITDVVEDGMGKSSTAFFHELGIKRLFSLEAREEWRLCECNAASHVIFGYDKLTDAVAFVKNPETTLLFIDGLSTSERFDVLKTLIAAGCVCVIEHDAESFTQNDLEARKDLLVASGYTAYQYCDLDPETAVYAKKHNSIFDAFCKW